MNVCFDFVVVVGLRVHVFTFHFIGSSGLEHESAEEGQQPLSCSVPQLRQGVWEPGQWKKQGSRPNR